MMKKRIISLILVLAIATLALAGCAYNYEKDDMSKYAEFDADAFVAWLLSGELEIEDGEFGWEEGDKNNPTSGRWLKVEDAIFTTLVGLADKTDKKTEGTPDKYDTYYYCYYVTAEIENEDGVAETRVFLNVGTTQTETKMNSSKPTSIQLGMSTLEGLDAKIQDAVKSFDLTDKAYKTNATGTTKKGDVVVVSYSKSCEYADGTKDEKPTEVKYETIVLTEDKVEEKDKMTFLSQLVGITAGSSAGKDFNNVKETVDGKEATVTYSGVKVHWIVDGAITVENNRPTANITVKDTTFTDEAKKDTEYTDMFGKKFKLYNEELTYHIFPVYYIDVISAYDAKVILETIIAEKISAGGTKTDDNGNETETEPTFKVFATDSGFVNGEKTANALVVELVKLYETLAEKEKALEDPEKKFEDAKTALTAAETALTTAKNKLADAEKALEEAGQEATDQQKQAVTDAKAVVEAAEEKKTDAETAKTEAETAYNTAKGEVDTAEANVDAKLDEILACTKTETVEGVETVKKISDEIVDEYRVQRYDALEATYKSTVKNSVALAFYEKARELIKFKTEGDKELLPEREVKRVYEELIDNLEYEFYEGTDETSKKSNVAVHGTFENYIKSEYKMTTSDVSAVYDKIMEEARAAVKELVILYTLKDACDADVTPSDEDVNSILGLSYLYQLVYGIVIEEEDARHVVLFNNIMNYFLEEVAEDDYAEDTVYGENKIQYKNIKYGFKTED